MTNKTFLKEAAIHMLLTVCNIKSIVLYPEDGACETYTQSDLHNEEDRPTE